MKKLLRIIYKRHKITIPTANEKILSSIDEKILSSLPIFVEAHTKTDEAIKETETVKTLNPKGFDSSKEPKNTTKYHVEKTSTNTSKKRIIEKRIGRFNRLIFIFLTSFNNSNSHFKKVVSI